MFLRVGIQSMTAILRSDSFFFMSPFRSLVTQGCFSRITTPLAGGEDADSPFQQALSDAFAKAHDAGLTRPVVVGAIPFDTRKPCALFVPETWSEFSREAWLNQVNKPEKNPLTVVHRKAIPEQATFEAMVARAVALTATPQVDKIVLSRLIDITAQSPLNSIVLLRQLSAQNPGSFNFHVPLADGGVLLGASPELLVRKEGDAFASLPLAGSAHRHHDAVLDNVAGQQLLASQKDQYEHALVVQAMKSVLAPHCQQLDIPASPQLISTPTLWHLASSIHGIANQGDNVLSLASRLHPTPALSGFPHEIATSLIRELEPFDRELFGGIVGWCDEQGNGEWAVTIRCAALNGNQVRLFAGAGIVPASLPEKEWQETGVKLSTMLNVFGLN
ncbi:isochorismate synthase [Mangrovibacter phragmitis]|uniref:isochorismate synthase n=1 Tax=Mangrovibacter phragmitis TaxID=1691903 RepID=A0A1B7KYM2_9ENTR|nr:isochorismate synthase [Mangrovibacter phragmitis]